MEKYCVKFFWDELAVAPSLCCIWGVSRADVCSDIQVLMGVLQKIDIWLGGAVYIVLEVL